jgi:hypothetical protein
MKDLPLTKKILWAIIALLAAINIVQTTTALVSIYPHKKPVAFNFAGQKFDGLQKLLKNEKYIGYYTDQDIDEPRPMMELLQAQYTVIPLILDAKSLEHRYIIVNCTNIPAAIEKFKNLGARPMTGNNNGLFLVERPEFKP